MHARPRFVPFAGFLLALGVSPLGLTAGIYHLDPENGDNANDGSEQAPWGSLAAVAAAGKVFAAGDVLLLHDGHHGSPVLRRVNEGEVVVRPAPGARPTLKNLVLQSAAHWTIEGLEISPETAASGDRVTLLSISGGSDNVVRNCRLYTVSDTSAWLAEDWDTRACNGISISGTRHLVEGNRLRNVNFGISVNRGAPNNTVRANIVENFSGDGLRGIGDYGLFEYNMVRNCYKVNANHDDGFQSWSQTDAGVGTGVVRGVVLRGNIIIAYEDPGQPFRGSLQGIGCFDGFYEDWVIENNVVITNAWHGIALYGARNCRIVNNTVIDIDTTDAAVPWIMIHAHKDGTASSGNFVRNNLVSDLRIDSGSGTVDHNLEISNYDAFFADWRTGDLRLRAGCAAVDAGSVESAALLDITGVERLFPGNAVPDLGAYESGASGPAESPGRPAVPSSLSAGD